VRKNVKAFKSTEFIMKIITVHLFEDFYVFSHKKNVHFNIYALNDMLCLVWAASSRQNFRVWVKTVSNIKCPCLLHIADSGLGIRFYRSKCFTVTATHRRSLRKNNILCLFHCSFIWESAAFPHEARHLKKSSSSELEDVFLVVCSASNFIISLSIHIIRSLSFSVS
jgi:hypothetical protein